MCDYYVGPEDFALAVGVRSTYDFPFHPNSCVNVTCCTGKQTYYLKVNIYVEEN